MKKYERLDTQKFIERARTVHDDKYDYSLVEYIKATSKVCIICKKCGYTFYVLPHAHLGTGGKQGNGCKKCVYKSLPQNQARSHKDFVKAAKEVHGNKYAYLSNYVNKREKIKIQCLTCNDIFWQKPHSHLEGCGCKKCQYNNLPQNQPKDIKTFEEQCKKVHQERYEYCGDYQGGRKKIKIWCKRHSEYFLQNAFAHLLKEQGCPKCRLSRGEIRIETYLKSKNIDYEYEKKFSECCDKFPLSFDFWLPKYNLCIEFDGELHYYAIPRFGGINKLKLQQKHDIMKTEFCKKNHICLLRIPFFEIKDTEKLIEEVVC